MSDVPLVGIVDEEGFAAVAAPCETEALLRSVARGAVVEGIDDVEGAQKADGVIEEQTLEAIYSGWGRRC
jgi:hypothetical protein